MLWDPVSLNTVKPFFVCVCQAGRTEAVSEELVDSDARALYEAGEQRKGTDCSVFIDILTTRSAPHLRKGQLVLMSYSMASTACYRPSYCL